MNSVIYNKQGTLWNKYTPGSGVGGTSIAVRRAKLRQATSCPCSKFFPKLGLHQPTSTQQPTST